jgi:hypothetical protein
VAIARLMQIQSTAVNFCPLFTFRSDELHQAFETIENNFAIQLQNRTINAATALFSIAVYNQVITLIFNKR